MTSIKIQKQQEEIYKSEKAGILNNLERKNYRYALIIGTASNKIQFFKDRKSLYEKHPSLHPNAESIFGTKPLLIDYEQETNSKKWQKEEIVRDLRSINKTLQLHKENRTSLLNRLRMLKD